MTTVIYDESDVVSKKGKYYLTTNDTTYKQDIRLTDFKPYEGKGIIFNLASSYDDWNVVRSTLFNDTINVNKGNYWLYLNGTGSKKVTTGDNRVCITLIINNK